jgi:hypothetical protein
MNQQKLILLLAVAFSSSAAMAAPENVSEGSYYGGTSDNSRLSVGISDVDAGTVHVSGRAGFGVVATGINTQVDFQGLSGYSSASNANVDWNKDGSVDGQKTVYQFSSPYSGAPEDHNGLGVFAFSKIGSNDLWIGEWSSTGDVTNGTHTVYYFGKDYDSNLASAPASATYNVIGLNDYSSTSGGNLLSGELSANFTAGHLTGSISSSSLTINLGLAHINTDATITGNTASASDTNGTTYGGNVDGRFFNSFDDVAGTVTFGAGNSQYDTAFGGSAQ